MTKLKLTPDGSLEIVDGDAPIGEVEYILSREVKSLRLRLERVGVQMNEIVTAAKEYHAAEESENAPWGALNKLINTVFRISGIQERKEE